MDNEKQKTINNYDILESTSTEKLKMLGIEVVKEYDNGLRIARIPEERTSHYLLGSGIKSRFVEKIDSHGLTALRTNLIFCNGSLKDKNIILDQSGNIIYNEFESELTENIERKLIDNILKYGADYKVLDTYKKKAELNRYIGTVVQIKEVCSGKYQLVCLPAIDNKMSYALFDKKDNKIISYGLREPYIRLAGNDIEIRYPQYSDELSSLLVILGYNETGSVVTALSLFEGTHITLGFDRKETEGEAEGTEGEAEGEAEGTEGEAEGEEELNRCLNQILYELYSKTKSLEAENRYFRYEAMQMRRLSLNKKCAEELRLLGIDVYDSDNIKVIPTLIDGTGNGLILDAYGKVVNDFVYEDYGRLIIDGIKDTAIKEKIESRDYMIGIQHQYGLLEFILVQGVRNYEGILIDMHGNILACNIEGIKIKTEQPEMFERNFGEYAVYMATEYIVNQDLSKQKQEMKYIDTSQSRARDNMRMLNIEEQETEKYKIITIQSGNIAPRGRYDKINLIVFNKKENRIAIKKDGLTVYEIEHIIKSLK